MNNLYEKEEKDPNWAIVWNCINKLEKNQDLVVTTTKNNVVGLIVKTLRENNGR